MVVCVSGRKLTQNPQLEVSFYLVEHIVNKGRILREYQHEHNVSVAIDDAEKNGYKVTDNCEGRNGIGIMVMLTRGTQKAGVVRNGNGFALVEVIL